MSPVPTEPNPTINAINAIGLCSLLRVQYNCLFATDGGGEFIGLQLGEPPTCTSMPHTLGMSQLTIMQLLLVLIKDKELLTLLNIIQGIHTSHKVTATCVSPQSFNRLFSRLREKPRHCDVDELVRSGLSHSKE